MNWLDWCRSWLHRRKSLPQHLKTGAFGESEARRLLKKKGLKYLTANYRTRHGEIDLVFRDRDCLIFVEVKTRSREDWVRPEQAVDSAKRRRLILSGEVYVQALRRAQIKWRFDIVEVLLAEGKVREIRHLPNAFSGDLRDIKRR